MRIRKPREMTETIPVVGAVVNWRRRVSILRMVALISGAFLMLQVFTVAVLSFVVAAQRRHRKPIQGFPHDTYPEVAVGENHLKIYAYGRDLYDGMLAAIEYAKETICIESFIWKDDAVGREFKEKLIRRAEEGVAVYVIFDSFGNLVVPREFKRDWPPSVKVLKFQGIRRPWHIFDPRRYAVDHRKMLIVDAHIAFIGGYNIGDLYATEWRDTHLRMRGPAATELAQSFVDFWNRHCRPCDSIKRRYERGFDPLITIHGNDATRLTFPIRDMYIDAIDRAADRILLTNAYFAPDHILLDALKAAAQRGVDVQVLLPWSSNHILADWAARGYFNECLEAGIRLFGYKKAMIHAKTCTIDGEWSTIGTANLDRLSSVGNFEINIEIYSRELAKQMEQAFTCDMTNAFELSRDRWQSRAWYVKLSEWILAPLRVLL